MGEPIKIVDLAREMIRLSGLEPDIDIPIEFTGLRPGEKLFEELLGAEEGSEPTEHPKIYKVRQLELARGFDKKDNDWLMEQVKDLIYLSQNHARKEDIVLKLAEMLPTYKPTEKAL